MNWCKSNPLGTSALQSLASGDLSGTLRYEHVVEQFVCVYGTGREKRKANRKNRQQQPGEAHWNIPMCVLLRAEQVGSCQWRARQLLHQTAYSQQRTFP